MTMLLFFFFVLLSKSADAHIALTYPAAREPPLDCLKASRTPSPCGGVPRRNNAEFLTFYTNRPYNLTFRIAYPHQGGFRLSLWDANNQLVQGLWPERYEDGFAGYDDETKQECFNVTFLKPCSECFVRAERQAFELDDLFQSCSDVNVVDGSPQSSRHKCSNAGDFVDGHCQCDHLRSGPVCQYKDYCTTDSDCQNNGRCVEEDHSLIRRTCFCAFGYFGINCEMSDLRQQMPHNATTDCFNLDYPSNQEQFPKFGLFKETCYQTKQLNKNDVLYFRVVQDELEIILNFQSKTWIGLGWRPIDIDISCRLYPYGPGLSTEISGNETDAFNETLSVNGSSSFPLLAMNCLDLVIGSVLNGRSRIADYYTRDLSTPLLDSWYYGSESLKAAYGIARDGRTVIMFRRPIEAKEQTDHSLGPGKKFMVWAKGQEIGHYFHDPKSALEASEVGNPLFYQPNVLKYHGKRNRGIVRMELVRLNSAVPISIAFTIIFSALCASLL